MCSLVERKQQLMHSTWELSWDWEGSAARPRSMHTIIGRRRAATHVGGACLPACIMQLLGRLVHVLKG